MKFEWDEAKRLETLRERGLDFADVAEIDWTAAITIEDSRLHYGEQRFITFGMLGQRLIVTAWCWRGDVLRVISMRKANAREVKKYEQG